MHFIKNEIKGLFFFFFFTSISPFLSGPSLLWLSDTGGEPGGSEVELVDCDGLCSWYRRFLSFSSSVLIVLSVNSSLGGPSPSDSVGPLPGCVCEVVGPDVVEGPCCVWCAGLWGCDWVGGGAGEENGCWRTTGWTWVKDVSETGLGSWLAGWGGGTLLLTFSAWEVGGTIGQHEMSVTMDIPAGWMFWGSFTVWVCSGVLRAVVDSGGLLSRGLASPMLASCNWAAGVCSGSESQRERGKRAQIATLSNHSQLIRTYLLEEWSLSFENSLTESILSSSVSF